MVDTNVTLLIGLAGFALAVLTFASSPFLRPVLKFRIIFSASLLATSLGAKLLLAADGVSGVVTTVEREDAAMSADIGVDGSHAFLRIGDVALCWLQFDSSGVVRRLWLLGRLLRTESGVTGGPLGDDSTLSPCWFRNMLPLVRVGVPKPRGGRELELISLSPIESVVFNPGNLGALD